MYPLKEAITALKKKTGWSDASILRLIEQWAEEHCQLEKLTAYIDEVREAE